MIVDSVVEFAIIGAALNSPETIPTILTRVTPQDMTDTRSASILGVIADLWGDNKPVDPISVAQELGDSRVTASDIFDMVQQACLPTAVPHHLNTIAEHAAIRRLSAAGQRIYTLAESGESAQSITQHAQELIDTAVRADDSQVRLVGDTLEETLQRMVAASNGEKESGLPTGFTDLDDLTNGLAGGQMVIIAARPGVGKSTLAVDFMRHASMRMGVPSLMFSLEMSANEVNQRVLAAESNVGLTRIVSGSLNEDDWGRVNNTAPRIAEAPMYVDDSDGLTITDIVAKSRMHVERKGVGLLVVDYLQLLRSDQRMESREQEIATYSRAMKLLAKSCNVPVVVVAQLNRESVRRGGKPMASDLRESGALEQDADLILLIDRPDAGDPDHAKAGEADVIVGKNRRGRTGTATLASQLKYSRFANFGGSF